MSKDQLVSKVFYLPLEAAVRWADLLHYESMILTSIPSPWNVPEALDCPRREELGLCIARIHDGILNGDLPFGYDGITIRDSLMIDSPNLTVRHVDLKRWMREHYPEHRPPFLFSHNERIAHPVISVETGQAMLIERLAVTSALDQCRNQLHELQQKYTTLLNQSAATTLCAQRLVSDRAETTYLNIIGGMLELMLGNSPSGAPYSSFRTQEAIVSALLAHHSGTMGIAERTLNGKFAIAKRHMRSVSA